MVGNAGKEMVTLRRIIFPVSMLFAATHTMLELLEVLKGGETPTPYHSHMVNFAQFTQQIGLPEIQELERRYGVMNPRINDGGLQ